MNNKVDDLSESTIKILKRECTGLWIPIEILELKFLSITEKYLWAEIHSLHGENGCFATNRYLANFLDLHESNIRKYIARLEKSKLITIEWNPEGRRIIRSALKTFLNGFQVDAKEKALEGGDQICSGGCAKSLTHIDNRLDIEKDISKDISKENATAKAFASSLFGDLKSLNEKMKEPNLVKWAKEIDLMMRLDKRSEEDVRKVLEWIKTSWWSGKIQSPKKLREKFDTLMTQIILEEKKKPIAINGFEENKALGKRAFDLISSKTTDAYFMNGNPTLDEHYFAFGGGYGRPDTRVVLKFSMPKAEFAEGIYKLIPSLRPNPKEAEPTEAQREEVRRQSIELQTVRIIPSKKEEPVIQMPEETEAEKEEIRKALNKSLGGHEFKPTSEDGVETKADTLSTIVEPNRPILEHFNPTVNRRMVLPKTDEQKARRLEAIAKLKPVTEFMKNLPLEAK